ncbi:MAG: hypothetical protein WCO56_18810 [Verrucomicrobiota bacterium]
MPDVPRHEIERAVMRLNQWFAENKHRIPPRFDWSCFNQQRFLPRFQAVQTAALKDWKARDLDRLFRINWEPIRQADHETWIPVELLVADKSLNGKFLHVGKLLSAVLGDIVAGPWLGRLNPRLWWFWLNYPWLIREIETFVSGIRLRVDATTPVPRDQRRVFEDFTVPLENGQQTAIGKGCMFNLEYARPHGAVAHWRFSITQNGDLIIGPYPLKAKPIYHEEALLAVIKKIDDEKITLSILTSEGA